MKTIFNKYKIYFAMVAVLVACSDDQELNLIEPSHRVIYTSEMDFQNQIEVMGEIGFGDASAGVESRVWTFPDNVVDIIGSDNDKTSTEWNPKAIFTQVGEYNVELSQTFKKDAFVGTELRGRELDTTIVVTVLEPVQIDIQAFYLNDDGSRGAPLNMSQGAENELTASKSIQYTYLDRGSPVIFNWEFEGGDPAAIESADPEIDVKYKRTGSYDVRLIAGRERPFGADTIYFNDLVKVIPSTDPVTLDGVYEKDGAIALNYSREMDPLTTNKDDFSIVIENNGTIINPSISAVSIDQVDGNVVLIHLDNESVYNDDIVTVSYTPGLLKTLDGIAADEFTDEQMLFNNENILETQSDYDYSFENTDASNWPYMWWGGIWGEYDLEISNEKAFEGNSSAYIEFRPNGGMIIGHTDTSGNQITFPVEAGKTYEVGFWVYVEDLGANDPAAFDPDIRFFWFPDTDWAVPGNPTFGSDFTTGEWVYSSMFVEFSTTGDKTFQIRGYNEGNPERLKFYMDNLSVSEAVLRP